MTAATLDATAASDAESPGRARLIAAFAAIYLFWGATFLALRIAVQVVPPLLTIATRCGGGAVILVAWLAVRRQLVRPTAAQWRTAAVAGVLLFLGCHAVLAFVERRVSSGQAALYMTAIPLWTVAIAAVRAHRRPALRVVAGLALGVAGVAVLVGSGESGGASGLDVLALVGSSLAWAAGSLFARDGARVASAAQGTAMQLAAGAAVLLALSAATGDWWRWPIPLASGPGAGAAALALAFLVVCGTVFGFAAYTWLMQVARPAAVSAYAFVNPVVAVALAWAVGDGAITGRTLAAMALVVGAVALTWERGDAPARRSSGRSAGQR